MSPLDELLEAIDNLPERHNVKLLPIVARAKEQQRRRYRLSRLVDEALQQLRLDMKYLIFDRDCTRRERDEARQSY